MKTDNSIRRSTLMVVTEISFITTFMSSAINLAIPSIGHSFSSSTILLGWIVTVYILTTATFLLPFGRFADIYGRKKILIVGLITFSVFTLLCGLSWSVSSLLVFRALQGLSSSAIFSTNIAILVSAYPSDKRGKVLGISTASTYLGLSLGPVIGGTVNHYLGWRSIFYFTFVIGVILSSIASLKLKEQLNPKKEKYDLIGSTIGSFGIALLLYGISSILISSLSKYIIVLGVILIILFLFYEKKQTYPILPIGLFKNNLTFSMSNLAAMINYSATFAISFFISLFLQEVLDLNSSLSGLILLAQPIVMALISPFSGRLSDRIASRYLSSGGMAIITVGLFILIFLSKSISIWIIVSDLALVGVGFALFTSPNSNAVMSAVEKEYYGIASSLLSASRLIGQALSMAVVNIMISIYIGNSTLAATHPDALTTCIRVSFIIFTVTCLIGVFASFVRGKKNDTPAY